MVTQRLKEHVPSHMAWRCLWVMWRASMQIPNEATAAIKVTGTIPWMAAAYVYQLN